MHVPRVLTPILLLIAFDSPECNAYGRQPRADAEKITVTVVQSKSPTITQRYRCEINSFRHIDVRTPADGYVATIHVKMGQAVKQGDLLFQVGPSLDEEKPDAENRNKAVSVKAPFDGLIGRLPRQMGSFVLKGETLTTLSDNSLMWVSFNVPEIDYLEYMTGPFPNKEVRTVELVLANGTTYPHAGKINAIGSEFNTDTPDIVFRADIPNPDRLLRHGQTGTVLINRVLKSAIVIPQRATFEILDKPYVYVVDRDHVARQREIVVQSEIEDFFLVKKGVEAGDTIVLKGVRLVHDGDHVE